MRVFEDEANKLTPKFCQLYSCWAYSLVPLMSLYDGSFLARVVVLIYSLNEECVLPLSYASTSLHLFQKPEYIRILIFKLNEEDHLS